MSIIGIAAVIRIGMKLSIGITGKKGSIKTKNFRFGLHIRRKNDLYWNL